MAASGLVLLAKSRSVDRLLGAAYAVAAFPTYQLEPEEREHVANGVTSSSPSVAGHNAGKRSRAVGLIVRTSIGSLVISSGESEGHWIGPVDRIIKALVLSPFVSQKMASFTVKPNKADLQILKQFIEHGTLTPVIDRTYRLAQVPEAIRYLEEGHARGKIIIIV